VLEYGRPDPHRSFRQVMVDLPTDLIEACGGFNWFMFLVSMGCLEISFFMPRGGGMITFGLAVVLWFFLLDRWSRSSFWF
jgi:hypothetical protein